MSPNRLADEQSPYLRQHAENPVDWVPWGEAAFAAARRRDVPIFLSVGYATCHWCHVMAHESFEDEEVAARLNRGFVPVKVDREERPDVDAVYMTVCQMLNGHGGWPLTVVLTPGLEPFFAGTYFPRASRGGRIGMLDLLPRLEALWRERRDDVTESAASITAALRSATEAGEPGTPGRSEVEIARRTFGARYDAARGGFGDAPKFPSPHVLGFLLREWEAREDGEALEMVVRTLHAMRRGGIHDQLGGGFHRYSTDAGWKLPHFEKMLYDQALLAIAYVEGWEATGEPAFEATARRTLDYVVGELADPAGGFHSAEDADSEGEEGKYYVWTERELADVFAEDDDVDFAVAAFGLEPRGNFRDEATGRRSGANVLLLTEAGEADPERLAALRARLLDARRRRVRPARDDKVLADWNGLAIAALARAARAFGDGRYAAAARGAATFVDREMRDGTGGLLHRWRAGEAAIPAFADDYAYLAWGLVELYEATFDVAWLEGALAALDRLLAGFAGPDGALRQTAGDDSPLVQVRESSDGALPSANSVAALTLLRAARLTGRPELEGAGRDILRALGGRIAGAPAGHAAMLQAVQFAAGPTAELVVAGPAGAPATPSLIEPARAGFRPRLVTARKDTADAAASADLAAAAPFTAPLGEVDGRPAAWLCRDHACDRPTTDPAELAAALDEV